jgi:zinc protease
MDDIWRVYETYIKDRNYVLTSFVPQGRVDLVAAESQEFPLKLESLEEQQTVAGGEAVEVDTSPIPSAFDRSQEPPKGPDPLLAIPEIWQDSLSNEMEIFGIEHNELPLVQFSITIPGGDLADEIDKPAVADLLSGLMMEGTQHKTPVELEEAIDELGAAINMSTGSEQITVSARMLASKFPQTIDLVQEILFEPRWDEKEFDRLKSELTEQVNRIDANPSSTAGRVFGKLVYGKDNIFAYGYNGTPEGVRAVTMDDLKAYYAKYLSPSGSYITIVGDISHEDAVAGFESLAKLWKPSNAAIPEWDMPQVPEQAQLYLVDFPGAMQSEIRIGYPALKFTDDDYHPVQVMNYKLGGSFNSVVNLILREEKGYTYGARTGFSGSLTSGTFAASAAVQATATQESVQIFHDEMEKYRQGVSEEDIAFTKNSLIKSNSLRFETLGALLGMLNSIAKYDLPFDYVKQQEDYIRGFTRDKHQELAQKYINPGRMIYLVVGDAETQLKPLSELGLGEPVLLDKYANPID